MTEDPAVERLRDAVGALRALYAATSPRDTHDRAELKKAGASLASTLTAATSRAREKEMHPRLAIARRDLRTAAQAVPWAARAIEGVLAHLKPIGGHEASRADDPARPVPKPPWFDR